MTPTLVHDWGEHMRKHFLALTMGALALALMVGVGATVAGTAKSELQGNAKGHGDNFRTPRQKQYDAALQKALQDKLEGKTTGSVHRANGQWVKLEQTGKDKIFVVLVEFGDNAHPTYPDGGSNATTFDGPHAQRASRSRTAPSTTRRSGSRTSARRTTEHVLQPDGDAITSGSRPTATPSPVT